MVMLFRISLSILYYSASSIYYILVVSYSFLYGKLFLGIKKEPPKKYLGSSFLILDYLLNFSRRAITSANMASYLACFAFSSSISLAGALATKPSLESFFTTRSTSL